jgi:hypothetical protein
VGISETFRTVSPRTLVNKGAKLEKPRSGTQQPLPDPAEALRGPARVLRIEQHPPSPSMDPVRVKETVKPQGTP